MGRTLGLALALLLALAAPAAAASPKVTFYFGLDRPETSARQAFTAVQTPGSATYRRFAAVPQVARRYGASPDTVRAFRHAAEKRDLRVKVDASRVFARVTGTVAQFQELLGLRLRREFNNDVNANIWFPRDQTALWRLPKDMRPYVEDLVPVYSHWTTPPKASGAGTRAAQAPPAGAPGNAGTWTGGCEAAKATQSYAFDQVRQAYGIDALGTGAGARVAILNAGESVLPADVKTAADCFGYGPLQTKTILTDGQRKPFGRGSFEPQEDLALFRGMAPGAADVTFTQTWLATQLWFLGPAQVLSAKTLPDVLSISYGECERVVRGDAAGPSQRAGARLMDAILVRLGLAGVGTFASAGDFGSTCDGSKGPAGVAWPGSSPYLTSVGGTRLVLNAANERVDEVVWNDLAWLSTDNGGGAGGGGPATFWNKPAYQAALPGSKRLVPDVSAHASMLPGWPVAIAKDWLEDAGTSSSSPLVATAFAILSANERAAGRPPLGPVNGLMYAAPPATVFDVVSGNNRYAANVPGLDAAPGYDQASGLGVPRFDVLAGALPASAP